MTKNKNRLDDSELKNVDENAKPTKKPLTPEEMEELSKKLDEKLKAEVQKMLKKSS